MWTRAQVGTFQRGLATAQKWAEAVEMLKKLAQITPAFADRVQQLSDAREQLELLCSTALQVDPHGE